MTALLAVPACLALGLTWFNLMFWPMGRDGSPRSARVSVLIPARDEAKTIGRAVEAALADPSVVEVVVYDDGSTDGTADVLAAIADARLRVVPGGPLPAGWIGKPHACHQLGAAATGDVLMFVDADVVLRPGGVGRVLELFDRYAADVVTAVPLQIMGSWFERLVLPLLGVTYTSWLPLPLIWWSKDPRFLAANGQILAVRRSAWAAMDGFVGVRDRIVDDMAFCRLAKARGRRVVFADGANLATCRMYDGARAVVRGFSKNLYPGLGSPVALVAAVGLNLWAFVVPYVLVFVPAFTTAAAVAIAANVLLRVSLVLRWRHPWSGVCLHPVGVLALIGIAARSWWWSVRGRIEWRGRVYPHAGTPP